ncbi:MAG: IS4 family transposase, partial [Leptodesmis sp.]
CESAQQGVGEGHSEGRSVRRHSRFYIGLSGQSWLNFQGYCAAEITELMRLNRNKRKYYLKGLRAMELVLSTS